MFITQESLNQKDVGGLWWTNQQNDFANPKALLQAKNKLSKLKQQRALFCSDTDNLTYIAMFPEDVQ